MPNFANAHDFSFLHVEQMCTHAAFAGKILIRKRQLNSPMALQFSSEDAVCKVQACNKVTTGLSPPNDTQFFVGFACSRPASAQPLSRQNKDYAFVREKSRWRKWQPNCAT